MYRLDPGNEETLRLFDMADIAGFAKAAHPLVSVLLYRSVEFVQILPYGSGDDDYDDSDDYFFDSDDDDDDDDFYHLVSNDTFNF